MTLETELYVLGAGGSPGTFHLFCGMCKINKYSIVDVCRFELWFVPLDLDLLIIFDNYKSGYKKQNLIYEANFLYLQ